ncbi:MAG: hypothetical protein NVSMB49_04920 [Ktedonobacteraceae bacterium]
MTANISSIHDYQFVSTLASVEGGSQELVDFLQKIVYNAGALLEVHNCSIAMLDARGSTLVTLAVLQKNGRTPRHTRFRVNEGAAGWVAENCEPLVINDVRLDPRFKRLGHTPIGSMMCVPLIDEGRFIGTLTASSQESNAFDTNKAKMMITFAEQAVLAIINARNAELAHHQTDQLEMLMSLARGITTRQEADALYRTILINVQHVVPCDLVTLYLYQEGTQELSPIAELYGADTAFGDEQEIYVSEVRTADLEQEKIHLYDTQSVTAWAAVHKHPMLRSPSHEARTDSESEEDTAELSAPLVSKHILYGVLSLKRVHPFTSEELRIVRNLGNMAAAALENVELFHLVRTEQEQLRAILASSSDGIALLGVNACFIEVNAAFGRIFGIDPEQIVGMECIELLGCEEEGGSDVGHICCRELYMVHRALQQEEVLPYTEVDLTIQGVSRSVGLSITRVSTKNKPICLMMVRDVTAIRDATRMKANFISMITHELRSPLNAINGYLDLALSGVAGELNDQLREFLQRSRSGSEQLYGLVEDLLLVSRADAGQLRLSREVISLNDVITDAVEELELTATDRGVQLSVDIADNFPQLYADPVRMQQVLRNLISNALRFTSSGGSVTVAAIQEYVAGGSEETEDRDVRIAKLLVKDSGCGIAPEHQQRIFERFYQVPQTAVRVTGQGLGLAIVKMIIELHGGTVSVESVVGEGSMFTCVLPCVLS